MFKDRIVSVLHALKDDLSKALHKAAPAAAVAPKPAPAPTPSTSVPTPAPQPTV